MLDHFPERRRYIRSRADLEFQLARMTLALSRAPLARQPELRDWFHEASCGLVAKSAPEHREYVEERVENIRETFFGEPPRQAGPGGHGHGPVREGQGEPRMH